MSKEYGRSEFFAEMVCIPIYWYYDWYTFTFRPFEGETLVDAIHATIAAPVRDFCDKELGYCTYASQIFESKSNEREPLRKWNLSLKKSLALFLSREVLRGLGNPETVEKITSKNGSLTDLGWILDEWRDRLCKIPKFKYCCLIENGLISVRRRRYRWKWVRRRGWFPSISVSATILIPFTSASCLHSSRWAPHINTFLDTAFAHIWDRCGSVDYFTRSAFEKTVLIERFYR